MDVNVKKKKKHTESLGWRITRDLILLFFLVLNIFPLIWIFVSSFKSNREILSYALSIPENPSFINYISVLKEPGMIQSFVNSGIATALSMVLNVAVCYLAAYTISRFDFKFLKIVLLSLSFGLLIPINSSLLPIKLIMDTLHLSNSVVGLGILYAAIQIPMSVMILQSHVSGISRSIDEAARIDGAGNLRIAISIIGPIAKPGIITVIILQSVFSWNEFLFALTLISDQSKKTLQLIIRNFLGLYQSDYGALFAAVMMAIIPMVVVFVLFQNKVIEAFTAGSVK